MNEDRLGHLTFRELQKQNADFSVDDYLKYVGNYKLGEYASTSLGLDQGVPERSPIYTMTEGRNYIGNSKYDQDIYREQDFNNIFDVRAENQPWLAKVGNGLAKGALTFGTTYLQGNLGMIAAIGQGIANMIDGDKNTTFLEGFVDNPYLQIAYAVSKWGEDVFPNYYSSKEIRNDEEGKWWKNMASGNFIGDKILKNAGFTIGAVYSSAGISAGLAKLLPKVAPVVRGAATTTLMAISEAGIDANNNMNDDYIEKGKQELDKRDALFAQSLQEKYTPLIRAAEAEYETNKGKQLVGNMEIGYTDPAYTKYTNTLSNIQAEMQAEMAEQKKVSDAARQRLADTRLKVAAQDFVNQLPVLLFTEGLQWSRMFANGWKTANRTSHIINNGKLAGKAGTSKAAGWLSAESKAMQRMRGIGKGFARGMAEAGEEIGQKIAYEIPKTYFMNDVMNFYEASMDPEAEIETMSRMNAFRDGLINTLKDPSTWEEGFLGFLPGAFGVPTFGRRFTNNNETWIGRNKPVGIVGGIGGAIRENNLRLAQEQVIIDALNKRVQEPDFVNYWQGMIRHDKYQSIMDEAVDSGDKMKFEDANQAQMIGDIVMFDNAGKLDELIDFVSTITDESPENIEAIIEQTTESLENNLHFKERMSDLQNKRENTAKEIKRLSDDIDEYGRLKFHIDDPVIESVYNDITGESTIVSRELSEQEKKVKLDDIERKKQETIQKWNNLNDEANNIENEIKTLQQDAKKLIDAFVDENGNVYDKEEYAKKKIAENRKDLLDTIKLYRNNKREIDSASDHKLTSEQLSNLTWLKTHTQKWVDRMNSIDNTLKKEFIPQVSQYVKDVLNNTDDEEKKENANNILEFLNQLSSANNMATVLLDKDNLTSAIALTLLPDVQYNVDRGEIASMLTDLPVLAAAATEYNRKFAEYMANADKLEQDMLNSRKKTSKAKEIVEKKLQGRQAKKIADAFDWTDNKSILDSFEAHRKDIDELGGEKVFKSHLTNEQRKAFDNARGNKKVDDTVSEFIDESDLTLSSKRKLKEALKDKSPEEVKEFIDDLINEIPEDGSELPTEKRKKLEEERLKVREVLDDTTKLINEIKSNPRDERDYKEKDVNIHEEEGVNPGEPKNVEDNYSEPRENTEPGMFDPDVRISDRDAKAFNDQSRRTFGYNRAGGEETWLRPQISEMYIHGVNHMRHSDYLDEVPEAKPEMLDGYTYKQFREYLAAIEDFLQEKGAFDYVKYHLRPGDAIEFVVEEIGGQEVVLMRTPMRDGKDGFVTNNGEPVYQIIGSLPAEIDFHYHTKYPQNFDEETGEPAYWKTSKDTLKERDPYRYKQYKEIIDAYHADKNIPTTTVTTKTISQDKVKDLKSLFVDKDKALGDAAYEQEGGHQLFDALWDAYNCIDNPNASEGLRESRFNALVELATKYPNNELAKRILKEVKTETTTVQSSSKPTTKSQIVPNAFATAPNANGEINVSFLKNTSDERTYYGLRVNGTTADLVLLDKSDYSGLLSYKSDMLYPVASFEDSSNLSNASKLYMVKPGKMHLVGDKWVVSEKMVISTNPISSQETTSTRELPKTNVYGKTEVDELMGGMLSLMGASKEDSDEVQKSKTEVSVKSVFGQETPIIGIYKGNEIVLSDESKRNKLILPNYPKPNGQIFVFIPTNKGSYLPAKVYGEQLNNITNSDYIESIVNKIMEFPNVSMDEIGRYMNDLHRILRLSSDVFRFDWTDSRGKKVDSQENASKLTFIYEDWRNNKKHEHKDIKLVNGQLMADDVRNFIMEMIKEFPETTVGVDINQITNPDYLNSVTDYLKFNVDSPHSVNDWFTYKAPTNKGPRVAAEAKTSKDKTISDVKVIEGRIYSMDINNTWTDASGRVLTKDEVQALGLQVGLNVDATISTNPEEQPVVEPENNGELTPEEAAAIRGEINPEKLGEDLAKTAVKGLNEEKPQTDSPIDDSKSFVDAFMKGFNGSNMTGPEKAVKNMSIAANVGSEEMTTEKELYKDIAQIRKLFPNLAKQDRIILVDRLIDSVDKYGNPIKVYGKFMDGVLYISTQSPRGVAYHESFHYLTDVLLDPEAKSILMKEARAKYNLSDDMEIEDNLAESFRKFMNGMNEKGLSGTIRRIFERLKYWINTILNNRDSIDILFWNIYSNRGNGFDVDNFQDKLTKYAEKKYDYDHLDNATKNYLTQRKLSKEFFNNLSYQQKEYLLYCM